MLIKNTFQSLRHLQEPWHSLANVVHLLYTAEHRKIADGIMMEQIKEKSLPILTFLNCVSHIVNTINYDLGATEVRKLYDDLDKANTHYNKPPRHTDLEYEYCCNTFYERTVIFAGVYYIISIEHPELTEVLNTVYKAASYEEGQPYINHFIFELRKKLNGKEDGTQHIDDFIPPHIIPDVHALMGGYRQLTPKKRLREFRKIELAIQSLPQGSRTIEIDTLNLTIKCAIRFLKRTFSIEEDAFIPENEKVTLSTLLDEYKSIASSDENGVIAAFLERVISAKEPSAQDPLYLEVLRKYQAASTTSHQSEVTEDIASVATSQPTEEQPQTQATTIDPSSLIFKTNEVNRAEVEALLKETLSASKKKSVVCRKLYLLRDKFNLTAQEDTTKANIINAWLEKFGIAANFKGPFNRKDFGSYYNKE